MEYLIVIVSVFLFGAFLYWAYLPDYRREPKTFWKTILGVFSTILLGMSGFNFSEILKRIKKWASGKPPTDE